MAQVEGVVDLVDRGANRNSDPESQGAKPIERARYGFLPARRLRLLQTARAGRNRRAHHRRASRRSPGDSLRARPIRRGSRRRRGRPSFLAADRPAGTTVGHRHHSAGSWPELRHARERAAAARRACNVSGRGLRSVVDDIQARVVWGASGFRRVTSLSTAGNSRASVGFADAPLAVPRRDGRHFPPVVLDLRFGARLALHIMFTLPLALIGGVVGVCSPAGCCRSRRSSASSRCSASRPETASCWSRTFGTSVNRKGSPMLTAVVRGRRNGSCRS